MHGNRDPNRQRRQQDDFSDLFMKYLVGRQTGTNPGPGQHWGNRDYPTKAQRQKTTKEPGRINRVWLEMGRLSICGAWPGEKVWGHLVKGGWKKAMKGPGEVESGWRGGTEPGSTVVIRERKPAPFNNWFTKKQRSSLSGPGIIEI